MLANIFVALFANNDDVPPGSASQIVSVSLQRPEASFLTSSDFLKNNRNEGKTINFEYSTSSLDPQISIISNSRLMKLEATQGLNSSRISTRISTHPPSHPFIRLLSMMLCVPNWTQPTISTDSISVMQFTHLKRTYNVENFLVVQKAPTTVG